MKRQQAGTKVMLSRGPGRRPGPVTAACCLLLLAGCGSDSTEQVPLQIDLTACFEIGRASWRERV
mgnify:CR=1 FL=1